MHNFLNTFNYVCWTIKFGNILTLYYVYSHITIQSAHILNASYWTKHTAHCTLEPNTRMQISHCTLHRSHWILYISHCTLHTAQIILQTAHCTAHTAHCVIWSLTHTSAPTLPALRQKQVVREYSELVWVWRSGLQALLPLSLSPSHSLWVNRVRETRRKNSKFRLGY